MKKFVLIILVVLTAALMCGCQKQNDYRELITQLRTQIFEGESDNYKLTANAELREQPFVADGKIGETENVLIFKFNVKNNAENNYSLDFTLDKAYTAAVTYNTISDSYTTSVLVDKLPEEAFTITVTADGNSENVELTSVVLNDTISYEKALLTVMSEKAELIEDLGGKNLNGELNIRLLSYSGKNLWYVGIVTSEQTYAYLVDGKSAKIVAEREINNNITAPVT